jgi:hypothetical protein
VLLANFSLCKNLDRIDELLAAAYQRLTPYLTNNPDISEEDRALYGIPPLGE